MFWKHYDNYSQHVRCLGFCRTAQWEQILKHAVPQPVEMQEPATRRLPEPNAACCAPGTLQRPGQRRNAPRTSSAGSLALGESGGFSCASFCPRATTALTATAPPNRPPAGSERAAASRGRGSCPPCRRPRSVEVLLAPHRLACPRLC
ncbi:hypothetical protein Q9966_011458 [Columba livia]|nr:hypothetical protein Q9966_011458 [Columba livia]